MGNNASGEEGAPESAKSRKKSIQKQASPPNTLGNDRSTLDKEVLKKEEAPHHSPPAKRTQDDGIKENYIPREKQNPETGSLRSSCVSIPDLIDAVNSPDYDPNLPFVDSEKGKPLFKKNSPIDTNGKNDDGDQQGKDDTADRPVRYTKETDLDQLSITNEEYL